MRIELLAIVLLASLTGLPAWAQESEAPPSGGAAVPNPAGNPSDARPEQAGDLYQSKTRQTGGEIEQPAKQDDPVAGALNPPAEPLTADRQADPKD
jgi:hypothetical protein